MSFSYEHIIQEQHLCNSYMEGVGMNSMELYKRWCDFQHIDADPLLEDMWKVLTLKENKKATLCLYGEPNAGKSWLVNSLLNGVTVAHIQIIETGQSDWMEAVNRLYVHGGEIVINERNVNMLKKVLSGEAVDVNVKYHSRAVAVCASGERSPRRALFHV